MVQKGKQTEREEVSSKNEQHDQEEFLRSKAKLKRRRKSSSTKKRGWFGGRKRRRNHHSRGIGDWLLWAVDILFLPITITVYTVARFFIDWATSRQARYLLYGMPALLVGLTVLGAVAYSAGFSKERLIRRYQNAAAQAEENENFDAAQVYYEKLTNLNPVDPRYRFKVGVVAEQQGDMARAYGIMKSLAPDDQPGYTHAHVWMAAKMFESAAKDAQQRSLIKAHAKKHLRLALQADGTNRNAKVMLAAVQVEDGVQREAVSLLKDVAEDEPRVWLQVARLERSMGNDRESLTAADRADRAFTESLRNDRRDLTNWILLNEAIILKRDYQRSLKLLDQAFREHGFHNALAAQAARSHVLWAQTLFKKGFLNDEEADSMIEHLDKALTLQPDYEPALVLLAVVVDSPTFTSEHGEALLQEQLAEGKTPAIVHFMLGSQEAASGNLEKAKYHFETAVRINNRLAPVLNNLAWTVGKIANFEDREENLAAAESYINQAIEIDPQNATFYETRGTILMEQGKYELALNDYLKARAQYGGKSANFHKAVAYCYEKVGNQEQAEANLRIAERLEAEQKGREFADPLSIPVKPPGDGEAGDGEAGDKDEKANDPKAEKSDDESKAASADNGSNDS